MALSGRHTLGRLPPGYVGASTSDPTHFSNEYFQRLANEQWDYQVDLGLVEYKARGKELYMLPSDILLLEDPVYTVWVHEYASDEHLWASDFAAAWTKVMSADLYDGPAATRHC